MHEHIEREAAFNALLKLIPKVDDDGYCWVIRGDAATAIDSIPAADVRPVVRGKWVDLWVEDEEIIAGGYTVPQCSVCKEDNIGITPFCPFCGADMRQTGDENV